VVEFSKGRQYAITKLETARVAERANLLWVSPIPLKGLHGAAGLGLGMVILPELDHTFTVSRRTSDASILSKVQLK
jgi:hypothetical protein